jgi:hypothetical protein
MGLLYYLKIKTAQPVTNPETAIASSSLFLIACILSSGFFLFASLKSFGQATVLDKRISIQKQHTSLYDALNIISGKADCLFVYDSQIVENDKRVKLSAENQPLNQVLDNILADPELTYKVIGQHILIYRAKHENTAIPQPSPVIPVSDTIKNIVIKGHIYDNENKEEIPFASIGILEENIGTISNTEGFFKLKVPATFSGTSLVVSHLGYLSQRIPIQLLNEQQVDIYLNRRIISIQEVIIRYIDPKTIVENAVKRRESNNSREPVYLTSFYREGVQKNNRYISYSEAVFKVYKSSYALSEHADQVKLLRSRKIQDTNPKDTVFLKLKAGVLSALQLDIVKCVPGFLDISQPLQYTYTYSDVVSYNARDAYAITFVQNKNISDALFTGILYVDKENYAVLGADFEINPDFIEKAADDLILKKSRKLAVKLEKISYSVSYTPYGGKYYLNHARCDIKLKTRLRHRLSSDNFSTFLEFATCHIDTANVVKFGKQEIIKPNVVFSDAPFSNDEGFWGDYNIIAPEAKLSEALTRIIGEIEKIE